MSYVGQVKKGSTTHLVGSTLYGTCSTAAGTAAKVGTLANFDALLTGVTVHLKMTNSNTVASPTLNVNGTGAKPITKYGTTAVGTSATTSWYAGSIVSFTYDGTSWVINDYKENTNTTYSAGTNLALSGTTFSVKDSPAFTGTPTAPTAGASTNTTQIATTAFTQAAILNKMKVVNIDKSLTGTLANSTITNISYQDAVKLTGDGVFIGMVTVIIGANTNGTRFASVLKYLANGNVQDAFGGQRNAPPSSGDWYGSNTIVAGCSANQAIGARMYQNSGSALSYTVKITGKIFLNFST